MNSESTDPKNTSQIESYLDQVLLPLSSRLTPAQNRELRRELHEHLLARSAAYQERGMTEAEAVAEALQQFGGAEDFLQQWRQEWRKTPCRLTLRDVYVAGRSAMRPSLAGIISVNLLYIVTQECIWHLPDSYAVTLMDRHHAALGLSLGGFAFLLLPLSIGARHGRQAPERAGIGMVAALTAEICVASLLYGVVALSLNDGASTGITNMFFNFLLVLLIGWLPVAGGAAAISGQWTQKRRSTLA